MTASTHAQMTHDDFNAQLMAFLEGDADDVTRASVERHAQQCAECGALLADLRSLRADSAKLPELTPSRDLLRHYFRGELFFEAFAFGLKTSASFSQPSSSPSDVSPIGSTKTKPRIGRPLKNVLSDP